MQNNAFKLVMSKIFFIWQSSRKIVCESRINEIKHVQNDKPLHEFTHKNHREKKKRVDSSQKNIGILNLIQSGFVVCAF